MRLIYQLLIYTLLPYFAYSQHTIKGKITHIENNEEVIGAAIYIPELRIGTSTDVDGTYTIKNIPTGKYTIEVKYTSHKTIIETIDVSSDTIKNFVIENYAVTLDEVIISGSSTKTIVKESPIPIATFSKTQWLQSSSTNLTDAVSKLPGMSQVTTGVGLSKPVIRGLGFNRVITMHDGIRQEDNQWGEEHAIQVDEYSIDRYEIIRGAGSLMYGSDGLGGVMSLLSARPVEEGKIIANVLGNYQTNNNMYGWSAMTAGTQKGVNWMLRTSQKSANNYRNQYDGRVYGSNFREDLNVNGMVGISKKWGFSRLYFCSWNNRINIIDGRRDANGRFIKSIAVADTVQDVAVSDNELSTRSINPSNSQNLSNYKISTNNLFLIGKSSLMANVGYSQNHRKEYGNVLAPDVPDLYFYLQTLYYDFRLTLPEYKHWEVTIGTNGMYQSMHNKGAETLYPDFKLFDNGVFAFAKKKIRRLVISGGVRYDIRTLHIAPLWIDANGKFQTTPENAVEQRFPGFDPTYSNVSGSLGAVYNLTEKLLLRANVSRAFRAPTVPELSSNGEHAGTYRYEIGNINAVPEIALQSDLGFTYETANIYVDAAIYQNNIQHYSYSERVNTKGGQDSIINGVPVFRYTQGNAQLYGGEVQVTINPRSARWFSFTQSYSAVFTQNLSAKNDSAKYLPFMPPPRWLSQLKFTRDRTGHILRNTYFQVSLEYNQAQNRALLAYNTETRTPDYYLLSAGIGTDFTNKAKRTIFSVYISAQNITDVAYQNQQNRLKYLGVNQATGRQGVYNMGRNISIKVMIPLDFKK